MIDVTHEEKQHLVNPAQMELRGFSRSLGELQWLLLVLVLLYSQSPWAQISNEPALIGAMVLFGGFVLGFRYLNFFDRTYRWKLAVDTWAMILFATVASWHTGGTESPLINVFLLILITSALTLGKLMTLLELVLITTIYFYMAYLQSGTEVFSLAMLSDLIIRFTPLLLVAYLTTMLASDIHYAKQVLTDQSQRDELTGLLNIRGFRQVLNQEIAWAGRNMQPLALMMIDADNLKTINDNHGHEAGNRLIRLLGETIHGELRGSDTVARYGGDEFIALLPNTTRQQAEAAAERIRKAVAETKTTFIGNQIGGTVSIGLAINEDVHQNADDLMQAADRALYTSKLDGRNKVTVHTEG